MSGEHEDHDNENHEREPRIAAAERTGLPDDESGPRASAHPVLDDSSTQPFSDEDESGRESPAHHRSAPPPRPRLKDSKYPPPATSASADAAAGVGAPPPRKKVISSPDLPPARTRTTPPPEAGSDPELGNAAVVPRAPARPHDMLGDGAPRPPLAPPPRQRMATLREESDDDDITPPPHLGNDERLILPPSGRVLEPPSAKAIEPPSVKVIEPPSARAIEPPSPTGPRVIAPSAAAVPAGPPSRLLVPPPKPERREEYVATYSRTPSLKPPPLPPSAERGAAPPSGPGAPAAPVAAASPPAPPVAAPPVAAPPVAAPPIAAPPVAAPAATAPAGPGPSALPVFTPPPTAGRPGSAGAATAYPAPSSPPPPVKSDSIAVHAIRVINIGVDDTALPAPPAPLARSDSDDFENIEDYAEEELEPPPDSLDEADVQALTEDELSLPQPPAEGAPPPSASAPATDVKLPPPPKRQAPSPPKKKGPRAPARKRPWWEEVFSEDFARATHHLSSRHIKREVDFIDHSLGVAQGAVVLDLACGTGEHSIELASRGYSVVGYDLSVYQLAIAGEAAQERELKINFLQGDMREMAFQEMFDGIFCWNTSFGYFEEEKNVAVAERIFHALRPGGMLLIDVVNRDHVMQHQPSQVWFQGDACVCMDDMSVDYITSRLRVKRSIIMDDGRTRECFYSIRLYTLHELGKLLHAVGFRVVEASGHPTTPGVYLGPNSPRVIILAQRP